MNDDDIARIRALNDRLRQSGIGGVVVWTIGVQALGSALGGKIVQAVSQFDEFTPDNDPHKEHDFGICTIQGNVIYWKIDYYDTDLNGGSADPSDDTITKRVLTIMLAEEY